MKNKKTTISGILTLILIAAKVASDLLNGQPVDVNSLAIALTTAVGLLAAKDHNVTGGTVQQ